jgi:hypothetical protein
MLTSVSTSHHVEFVSNEYIVTKIVIQFILRQFLKIYAALLVELICPLSGSVLRRGAVCGCIKFVCGSFVTHRSGPFRVKVAYKLLIDLSLLYDF